MLLNEFDFYSDRDRETTNALRVKSRFLCALYRRCFAKRFETKKTWKLEVKLVTNDPDPEVGFLGGVTVVELPCDVERLLAMPARKRAWELLQLLQTAAERACLALSWPLGPFREAFECVLSHDFRNEWIWKKSKWAPSRRLRAELFCQHESETFRMHLRLRDRADNFEVLKIIEAPPDEFLFARFFGAISWLDNGKLRWSSDDGEVLWEGAVSGRRSGHLGI